MVFSSYLTTCRFLLYALSRRRRRRPRRRLLSCKCKDGREDRDAALDRIVLQGAKVEVGVLSAAQHGRTTAVRKTAVGCPRRISQEDRDEGSSVGVGRARAFSTTVGVPGGSTSIPVVEGRGAHLELGEDACDPQDGRELGGLWRGEGCL